jgi:transposase
MIARLGLPDDACLVVELVAARAARDGDEQRTVWRLAGARAAPAGWKQRAQMVAASWDGSTVPQIAEELGCHEQTVRRWLHRFNTAGVDGLADRPGTGRPRRLTELQRSQIVALVGTPPPGRPEVNEATGALEAVDTNGPGCWTLDTLAEAAQCAGISVGRSQIRRILAAEGVRWRQPRSWAQSPDPEFAPKEPGSWSSTRSRRRTPRSSAPMSSAR